MAASKSNDTPAAEVRWTEGALKRMERAPIFLRGMVRRLAEKKARELGYAEITEATLEQFKSQMMGGMGGASGMAQAAEDMAQGRLPWTAAAKERLNTVPEFMRGMIRQIAEEVAREGGHMEVNVDLFERVEAMGDVREAICLIMPRMNSGTVFKRSFAAAVHGNRPSAMSSTAWAMPDAPPIPPIIWLLNCSRVASVISA